MNNYHIYDEEGRGKHSVVCKARKKKSLEYVAIKQTDRSRRKKVLNEAKILSDLCHPNLIKFHDWVETKNHLWVITEYCPGGDLLTLIQQDKAVPEKTVKTFIREIVMGLQYLHSNGVIFADLKPANILINQYGNLKLADLGSAKKLTDMMQTEKESKRGTPCYMAPELFESNGVHSFQSDFWALGCIMYELAQGHPPFVSSTFAEIVNLTLNSETPKIQGFSDQYNDLLCKLLMKEPERRVMWKELLQHPWLRPEIVPMEIPSQPHFEFYLESKKSTKKKVDIVRMSINLKKNELNEYRDQNINTNNRRDELDFGEENGDQDYDNEPYEEDGEAKEPEQKIEKKQDTIDMKQTIKETGKAKKRPSIPQVDDSSNLNLEGEKITKNSLTPMEQLLTHQSDLAVKPIIGNKDIEVSESFAYNKASLGFSYIEPDDLIEGIANGEMDNQLKKIHNGLLGDNKMHVIGYFQSLIQNSDISNYLIKSQFIPLFLKLVKSYKQPILRAKICEILGLLIRHATNIEPDVLKFGLTTVLIDVLKDKSEKVRRKAMAALGEFLFYGATQVDQNLDVWDMPQTCYSTLLKVLRNTAEDDIVRFYVCKTIENITAQAKIVGAKFAQLDIMLSLVSLYATAKLELMKVSIVSCFHHSITLNESLLQPLLDKLGTKHFVQTFENSDTNNKITQILLGLIITQLYTSPGSKLSKLLLEDEPFIRSTMQLLDNSSAVVKGRVMLYSYFLIKQNLKNIIYLHESKFFQIAEKQYKQGHKYLVPCLQHLVVLIQDNLPALIKHIQDTINYCKKSSLSAVQSKQDPRKRYNYGLVLLSIMNCSLFQDIFQNTSYLDQLFSMMDGLENDSSHSSLHENAKNTLMQIYQRVVSNGRLVETLQEYIAGVIFPKMINKITMKVDNSDIKFGCIKFVIYLAGFYLSEEYLYSSAIFATTNKGIIELISDKLLPAIDILLADKEPIPSFTLKLLALLFELQPGFMKTFKKLGKFNLLLDLYDTNSSKLTQNTLKIIQSFCASGELTPQQLIYLLPKTKKILSHYMETSQQLFIEFPLDILLTIINALYRERKENLSQNSFEIESIFELVLPLQGYEDVVVRDKATRLISTLIELKLCSPKGRWQVSDKAGLENYRNYLKTTGKKPEKQILDRLRYVQDKNIQQVIREIETL